MRSSTTSALAAATFTTLALARTDLEGCTSTDVSSPAGASLAWYVPGTGELCEFLDCGGGRAPPKTTVAGCPGYVGTETYSPSYMAGFQAEETAMPSSSSDAEIMMSSSASVDWAAMETDTAVSSYDLYTTMASESAAITDAPVMSSSEVVASPAAEITDAASSAAGAASSTLVAYTTASSSANGTTIIGGRPGNNGTLSNNGTAIPSAPISASGASAWVGSASLVMGLAALVAVL